ncbi:hypothetical protein [Altericroceibacterium endophyticum]|uniref:Lipoprotein n=1 Tax=Altericroceibacterium endophyticum TaxID=1808508 RepID=A0A6I4T7U0_9SPHN|nr:hypothetical protein [Altericroceibacterium endophyticum]MXO66758.1 hypothetical protein [Altericroceibacterium endophyticum]
MKHRFFKGIAAVLGPVVLSACSHSAEGGALADKAYTSPASTPLKSISQEPQQISRAAWAAGLLARADGAYEAGDVQRLSGILSALRTNGVSLQEGGGVDPMAAWSEQAGPAAASMRGRLLGPGFLHGRLAPGESWHGGQTFFSGKSSTVALSQRGTALLRLRIVNAQKETVCERSANRVSAGEQAENGPQDCHFTPLYTQRYNIDLRNEGPGNAIYYLVFD